MADTVVYFATNRLPDPASPGGFGTGMVDPADAAAVLYAVVPVTGIALPDESSGTLGAVTGARHGNFAATMQAEILAGGKNLLVFIHGFDNTFADAIKRAGFNRTWFAASGVPDADTTVLAFSWPSAGELFAALPKPPDDAYRADQAKAAQSCGSIAAFLANVMPLVAAVRAEGRRAFLLAHSMGTHALSGAVARLFAGAAPGFSAKFNEAILAAGDEVDSTLEAPGGDMHLLPNLADRVSVYASLRDVAMGLSMAVNKNRRLGYAGPRDKGNLSVYPFGTFRCVDCTQVFDFPGLVPPDATHQYYRRSPTVRTDIAALMAGGPVAAGVSALSAFP